MGNNVSIPHLQDDSTGSKEERRAAKINNHIRNMIWDWWYAAENSRGVYIERPNGSHELIKDTDHMDASKRRGVKKVLLFSNNGEDLNVFIEWVVDEAPIKVVAAIMACQTKEAMIDYVWKHGLQKESGKLWRLRTS